MYLADPYLGILKYWKSLLKQLVCMPLCLWIPTPPKHANLALVLNDFIKVSNNMATLL